MMLLQRTLKARVRKIASRLKSPGISAADI